MSNLISELQCLSESKSYSEEDIYEKLFDKKLDKRRIIESIKRFEQLNKEMLEFIGVNLILEGIDHEISLRFISSNYIGAVPLRMPYDGVTINDLEVTPRYNQVNEDNEIVELFKILEYSIKPDYADRPLANSMKLQVPLFYEASKYIDLFEKAYKYKWLKFEVVDKVHSFPKANTDWSNYSINSANPKKVLEYRSKDNIFSINHREWQELKYVFDLAKNIILSSPSPLKLKNKYKGKIKHLDNKLINIKANKLNKCLVRASDPRIIKETKEQANIILQKNNFHSLAWRIDMAELFEKYVQHLLTNALKNFSGEVISNNKIWSKDWLPQWGLKYLEPDILIKIEDMIIVADAKYKANYYLKNKKSEILKETHRTDIHQILAYCSFLPQRHKLGLLFYPYNKVDYEYIEYSDKYTGVSNKIVLFGIPLGAKNISSNIEAISQVIKDIIEKEQLRANN